MPECLFCGGNGPWSTAIQPIKPEEAEIYERDETRYSICRCGGHFQDPMPTDAALEEFYKSAYRSAHPDISLGNKRAKRIMPHLPKKFGGLLDVGCAHGALMQLAQVSGWQVAGVEPNENSRRQAKQFGDIYQSLDEVDRTFDLVSAIHVLEHVSDPIAFLGQLAELVSPGGEMLVVIPCYEHRPPHLLAMGGEQIRMLFERIGIGEAELTVVQDRPFTDVIAKARIH